MKKEGIEIIADEGKFIHRKGSDVYFSRATVLSDEDLSAFEEVDKIPSHFPKREPSQEDIDGAVLTMLKISSKSLSDEDAVACKALFDTWQGKIGAEVTVGDRLYYDDKLYKVRQSHTVQKEFAPSVDTAALYEEINEKHKGTADDPIPYNNNMRLELGKYYVQNDVVYKCTRDSGVAVYNDLKDLVGIYVESVK